MRERDLSKASSGRNLFLNPYTRRYEEEEKEEAFRSEGIKVLKIALRNGRRRGNLAFRQIGWEEEEDDESEEEEEV